MMQSVNITVRRHRQTGRPVLFFVNSNDRGQTWIEGYDKIGQRFECPIEYMRRKCAPIPVAALPQDAIALVREWSTLGEPVNAVIRQRLTFRKG